MKILQIIFIMFLIACDSNASKDDTIQQQPQNISSEKTKEDNLEQPKQITNGIVFKDAQGNTLSDAQKDSLVQYMDNIQALRRYDQENNNTEYILFITLYASLLLLLVTLQVNLGSVLPVPVPSSTCAEQ